MVSICHRLLANINRFLCGVCHCLWLVNKQISKSVHRQSDVVITDNPGSVKKKNRMVVRAWCVCVRERDWQQRENRFLCIGNVSISVVVRAWCAWLCVRGVINQRRRASVSFGSYIPLHQTTQT